MTAYKARVRIEYPFEIVGARGLALGARKGAHADVSAGMVVGHIGQTAQSTANIAHHDAGNVDFIIDFGNIGNGTRFDCLH